MLVLGLRMVFTRAATLPQLLENAIVELEKVVPAVLKWSQDLICKCFEETFQDESVDALIVDVSRLINKATGDYDAILPDVDNGP